MLFRAYAKDHLQEWVLNGFCTIVTEKVLSFLQFKYGNFLKP